MKALTMMGMMTVAIIRNVPNYFLVPSISISDDVMPLMSFWLMEKRISE
jgi:hypothetical protein